MAWCKRDVTPMLTYWGYVSFALNHPLHWRHNDHDGISNHQPHGCFLNRLFRRRSKKTSKLRVTGLCAGNSLGRVNSPHKGPVTRKMFPFDDVIMDMPWRMKMSSLRSSYLSLQLRRWGARSSLLRVVPTTLEHWSVLKQRTTIHSDVITWKRFPRYWPFARGIHRSPGDSTHNGQVTRALMFSLILF